MRHCNNAVFAAVLVGATLTLGAQERPVPPTPVQAVPRTVVLSVSVTDDKNRPFAGLGRENFTIYENDRPQQIATFDGTDVPYSIGIILDLSGSMTTKLNSARQAILRFMQTANPQDEFFLVGFADHVGLIQDFTNSAERIEMQLGTVGASGKTALYDGLDLGLAKMKEAHHDRKALLVVGDGGDNHSNVSEGKLRAQVRETDAEICSIGIFDPYAPTPSERSGPQLLDELGQETGGRLYRVDDLAEMGDIAERVSTMLRNQYLIGYRPSDPNLEGKWRKVKVKINPSPGLPRLNVHARTGYYAPLQ
jgi:Ca-activated chloride channel family protein